MPLDRKVGIVSADETAYLLPAMDPRPTRRAEAKPPEAAIATAAASPPDPALRAELLRRIVKVLVIVGILMLALYLLTKD